MNLMQRYNIQKMCWWSCLHLQRGGVPSAGAPQVHRCRHGWQVRWYCSRLSVPFPPLIPSFPTAVLLPPIAPKMSPQLHLPRRSSESRRKSRRANVVLQSRAARVALTPRQKLVATPTLTSCLLVNALSLPLTRQRARLAKSFCPPLRRPRRPPAHPPPATARPSPPPTPRPPQPTPPPPPRLLVLRRPRVAHGQHPSAAFTSSTCRCPRKR
mmetsp:Transcript_6537/g.21156  ORF Transcript_6537/g.21156 Transcript_6537/m.21156 type:complete len:212 (-) Transcript_6537:683-1318(-)